MTTYAIGDIHGCLTALNTVIDACDIQPADTLVFLGDYIDRGPDSRGVIDRVLELSDSYNVVTLRGNHEVMMLNAREDNEKLFMWQHFGGEETLDSYGVADGSDWQQAVPEAHWQFLEQTGRYYETARHIYVHAGLKQGVALEDQTDAYVYWKKFYSPGLYSADQTVICGHTARAEGLIADFEHTVCIDTFAYGGQWLSCLNTDTGDYWQANQNAESRTGSLHE